MDDPLRCCPCDIMISRNAQYYIFKIIINRRSLRSLSRLESLGFQLKPCFLAFRLDMGVGFEWNWGLETSRKALSFEDSSFVGTFKESKARDFC